MLEKINMDYRQKVLDLEKEIFSTEEYLKLLKEERIKSLKVMLEIFNINQKDKNYD